MSMVSEYAVYVYLFNADEIGEDYGYVCNKTLLEFILNRDSVYSRIYSGDVLVHSLCEQISEVNKTGNTTRISMITDKEFYISLLTELVNSIKNRCNTICEKNLYKLLANQNIYGVILTNHQYDLYVNIDKVLKDFSGYVGAFELDMGNPLHIILFLELMIYNGFLKQNTLYIEDGYGLDEDIIPEWAKNNAMINIDVVSNEVFAAQEPPLTFPVELSSSGERVRNIVMLKGEKDHYQKICYGLLENEEKDFHYMVNGKLSYDKIVVPKEKFVKYALDFEHEKGGKEKAKLFRDLLGITKENWRYLVAQIENGLVDGKLCNVRRDDYGIKYHIDIPIKGLNGISKNVRTAWIAKENGIVALVTVYIASEKEQHNIDGIEPCIVDEVEKDDFFEILYNLADSEATKAVAKVIPTPMFFKGYVEPVMEGICGYACIVIKDARKKFVRWLKKKNIGDKGYHGGWIIWAKTHSQSYEKEKVYAETFAKILQQNGIECSVSAGLD